MQLEELSKEELIQRLTRRFLDKTEVCAMFGFTRSTLYRRVSSGLLPPSVHFGGNMSRWISTEADAVFKAMASGKTEGEVKALVVGLIEQRETLH